MVVSTTTLKTAVSSHFMASSLGWSGDSKANCLVRRWRWWPWYPLTSRDAWLCLGWPSNVFQRGRRCPRTPSAVSSGACPDFFGSAYRHVGAIHTTKLHYKLSWWNSHRLNQPVISMFHFDFQCDFESSPQWVNFWFPLIILDLSSTNYPMYTACPKKSSWTPFCFDYGVHLLWHCVDNLM